MTTFPLGDINTEKVIQTILLPTQWVCQYKGCETTESLWVCLHCGLCICQEGDSIQTEGHLFTHGSSTSHHLYLQLNTGEHNVYSYKYDEIASGDNVRGDLFLLRNLLDQVQNNTTSSTSIVTRSGSSRQRDRPLKKWKSLGNAIRLSYFLPKAIAQRHEEDAMYTATFKWNHSLMLRSFNSWKGYKEKDDDAPRTPRSAPLTIGKTGLRNLGNTCYMNAVLQALCNVTTLRQYIKSGIGLSFSQKTSLHIELSNVFEKLTNGKFAAFSPDTMLSMIWNLFPNFSGFKQQDSDELLRNVFCQLENEKKNEFQKLCGGEMHTTVTCHNCRSISLSKEPLLGILSVEIPTEFHQFHRRRSSSHTICDLKVCLESSLAPETLSTDCQFFCDKCQTLQDATKQTLIGKAPPVFILQIVRTSWLNGGKKIQTPVTFPMKLNLEPYMVSNSQENGKNDQNIYSLQSFVVHQGSSLTEGHYTAYAYSSTTSSWMHYNDHKVKNVPDAIATSQQAYLMMYSL